MVPYNKIYGLNSENYKRADLEESIKKHWWKYLIGLGLAGGAGYLAYKAFFSKPKGGANQQASTAQSPEAPEDAFSVYNLLNLDTKEINYNKHWLKIHDVVSKAIEDIEKENPNDAQLNFLLGNMKSALRRMLSTYKDETLLSGAKEAIKSITEIVGKPDAPKHINEIHSLITDPNIASKAFEKINNIIKEHHVKIVADKLKQKIQDDPFFKRLMINDKNKHYPDTILKTVLGATFINHYIEEQMKHLVNKDHRNHVKAFLDNYMPLFARFGGNHGVLISKLIAVDTINKPK